MLKVSLQDSRAWTLYCLKHGIHGAMCWEDVPLVDKIACRIEVTVRMLDSLAPHRHP